MKYIYSVLFLFVYTSIIAQSDTILIKDPLSELEISASSLIGCVPMQVQFNASATEDIRFHWDFGDGESSAAANPTHTYLRYGKYSINCVAYYHKDSIILYKQDWISAYPLVYPNFNSVNKCACALPAEITFLNNTNSNAKYKWIFEGAETTDFEGFNPPPIRYPDGGKHDVSLIATTEYGCSDTLKIDNYVNVGHKVDFVADKMSSNCPPFPVSFLDKSLGCATKWKWNFGDGSSPSFSRDPVHIYSQSGDYTVSLYVSYEDGCTDSLVQRAMIHVGGPVATLQVEPLEVCEKDAVNFTFLASGYMFLEFAPGEIKLLKGLKDEPTHYIHYFKNAGTFLPSYTMIDEAGCLNKFFLNDSIRVLPRPETDFVASPSFGKKPLTFSLATPKENDYQYRWWIMGKEDTLESTENKPTFTLANTGRYAVQMVAFHPNGCSDTVLKKEFIAILGETDKNEISTVPVSATIAPEKDGSDDLNVTISSVEKKIFSIAILNELGAVVSAQMFSVQGLKTTKIKTTELPMGTYNIVIKTSDGKEVLQRNFGKK